MEEEIDALQKKSIRDKYKYAYYWTKIKVFFQETLKKNKIKNIVKQIKRIYLILNKQKDRIENTIKLKKYLEKQKENRKVVDYLTYKMNTIKENILFQTNTENICESIRLYLGEDDFLFYSKYKKKTFTIQELILYTYIIKEKDVLTKEELLKKYKNKRIVEYALYINDLMTNKISHQQNKFTDHYQNLEKVLDFEVNDLRLKLMELFN